MVGADPARVSYHQNRTCKTSQSRRIQEEANRKRSEAAREQHEVSKPYAGEKMVVRQSVGSPEKAHTPPATQAKAAASKTNPGAVARGF